MANSLLNSLDYIWASVERCKDTPNEVQCAVDITASIASINDMINHILGLATACDGKLDDSSAHCGKSVSYLTASIAHLATNSAGIAEHCPNDHRPVKVAGQQTTAHNMVHCLVDIKSFTKALFMASASFVGLKDGCPGKHCTDVALGVVYALGGLAQNIAGSIGHCSNPVNDDAACASSVLGLVGSLAHVGGAGELIQHTCKSDARLYLENGRSVSDNGINYTNFGFAALLPITAVVSFLAGRRMKSARQFTSDAEAQELIEDLSVE